jgi:hypothetical protein
MRACMSGEVIPSRVPGVFAFLGGNGVLGFSPGGLGLAFPLAGWLSLGFGLSV